MRRALEHMVEGAPVRVVQVGNNVFRLVRRRRTAEAPAPVVEEIQRDIIVTARKQAEPLSDVAAPISVYVPDAAAASGDARGAHDVATQTDGLTLTQMGSGRDKLFLRGIADSPFNGFSQSTVSVQLDDARITYDAAEPGIALVDVARVELLKGPQGPLYGTGALGGVYRIVTNRPVLGGFAGSGRFGVSLIDGGGPGAQAEGMINVPLASDTAAIRVAGYATLEGGWVNDTSGRRDINQTQTVGARTALRVAPAAGWTIDLAATAQRIAARDSQYVYQPGKDAARSLPVREPHATRLYLLQGSTSGPIGEQTLTVSTSHSWQDQLDLYDVSSGPFGSTARVFRDRRSYRVFDQEVRVASAPGGYFSWLAGASYLSATTQAFGDVQDASGGWTQVQRLHRAVSESAVFAEATMPVVPRLRATLGARVFRATTEDELEKAAGVRTQASKAIVGITPSASLAYTIAPGQQVYARFGTAFRPGGVDPANARTGRYDADEVRNFDLGGRVALDRGRLSIDGGLFSSIWQHVQSDYLLPSGLIATRNAGDARIIGLEAAIDWRPEGGWRIRAGTTLQRPRLTRAEDGTKLPRDRRLPVVPDVAGRIEISREMPLGSMTLSPYFAANFTGITRLSFDPGLDRRLDGYAIARAGAALTRDSLVARIDIDNLLDSHAAVFAFGNPFSIRSAQQFALAKPRTVTISLSHRF